MLKQIIRVSLFVLGAVYGGAMGDEYGIAGGQMPLAEKGISPADFASPTDSLDYLERSYAAQPSQKSSVKKASPIHKVKLPPKARRAPKIKSARPKAYLLPPPKKKANRTVALKASMAAAQGFYFEGAMGHVERSWANSTSDTIFNQIRRPVTNSKDVYNGFIWDLVLGYQLSPWWGVEAGYIDLPTPKATTVNNINISVKSYSYFVGVKMNFLLTKSFSLFSRVGGAFNRNHYENMTGTHAGNDSEGTSFSNNYFSPIFSTGLEYYPASNHDWSLLGEYGYIPGYYSTDAKGAATESIVPSSEFYMFGAAYHFAQYKRVPWLYPKNKTGLYLEGSGGYTIRNWSNTTPHTSDQGVFQTGVSTNRSNQTGGATFILDAGYQFIPLLSAEVGYIYLPTVKGTDISTSLVVKNTNYSVYAAMKGSLPITQQTFVFAKVAGAFNMNHVTNADVPSNLYVSDGASGKNNYFSPMYSAGVDYYIDSKQDWSINAEYTYLPGYDEHRTKSYMIPDTHLFTIGAAYKFAV